jgi:hypothetical protein
VLHCSHSGSGGNDVEGLHGGGKEDLRLGKRSEEDGDELKD